MNTITINERVNKIISLCDKYDIKAYQIGENTSLNTSGIQRILSGSVVKPRESTISEIEGYLSSLGHLLDTEGRNSSGNNFMSKNGVNISLDEISLFVVENEDAIMNKKIFSNMIEKIVAKRLLEITSSEDNFNKFLKG